MKKLCDECGGYFDLTPPKLLEELARTKAYYADSKAIFLPFKIKELEVANIGPLEHFKTELGELNIITGGNATGKSAIFNAVKAAIYKPRPRYLVGYELKKAGGKSSIRIKPETPVEEITVRMNRKDPFLDVKCIIADPGISLGFFTALEKLLGLCARKKMQLLLFDNGKHLTSALLKRFKVNVIRLPKRKE